LQHAVITKKQKLYFEPIPENYEDYCLFLDSINWKRETDRGALWPIIKSKNVKAIIGSDHQVVTMRRDIIFNETPSAPSMTKVGRESERDYVDLAIDASGKYRLATFHYHAHHMGNKVEPWMLKIVEGLERKSNMTILSLKPVINYDKKSHIGYKLKKKWAKITFKKRIPKAYFDSNSK
jgi:hypothetical protein